MKQAVPSLAVADAAHGRISAVQLGIALRQRAYFVGQALFEHGGEAAVDNPVQAAAVGGDKCQGMQRERAFAAGSLKMLAQWAAGEREHFQRPFDALAVVGVQASGGGGVERLQALVEIGETVAVFFVLQLCAHGGIGGGQLVQAAAEGAVVHHGAADNQRQAAAGVDFAGQPRAVGDKIGGAVACRRVDDVDQVVRRGGQLSGAGFGGADVHAAIHQRAVETDDLAGKTGGQFQRQRGFAAGGGAE